MKASLDLQRLFRAKNNKLISIYVTSHNETSSDFSSNVASLRILPVMELFSNYYKDIDKYEQDNSLSNLYITSNGRIFEKYKNGGGVYRYRHFSPNSILCLCGIDLDSSDGYIRHAKILTNVYRNIDNITAHILEFNLFKKEK